MGAHKFGSIQQGIVLVFVKVSEPSIFLILKTETKCQIVFCCTFQIDQKMIKFLVHDCFVESFHWVMQYFVSRACKFGNHKNIVVEVEETNIEFCTECVV